MRAIAQNGTIRDSRAATARAACDRTLGRAAGPAFDTASESRPETARPYHRPDVAGRILATLPFATPAGYIREFIPAYATAMFVISSITSALLFVQFSVIHSRALLAVSGDYVMTVSPNRSGNVTAPLELPLSPNYN